MANIAKKVENLRGEDWATFIDDNLPYGNWAKDILVNMYVVGDYHLVPNYQALGLAHLKNLLLLGVAYARILDANQADRVIANDSYYGMWAILQELCKRKNIPFYSHWTGARQNAWCYAYNDASMNLDFSKPWRKFAKIPLDERRRTKVKVWLTGRREGKEMVFDTASLSKYKKERFNLEKIDFQKPTAFLAANVIWDMAALNKQLIFEDMIEWIIETSYWFERHPEFQLIIKAHPGEMHPSIPATKERIEVVFNQRGINLPDNVFLLSPKINIIVYELFPFVKVGLVYTTTVGLEMAAHGVPVITTAKSPYRGFGFTIDPDSKNEYFETLKCALSGKKLIRSDLQLDLAYKFILFSQYHYYTKIDIMDYVWGQEPKLKVKSAKELLPGKNRFLDYVIDSIMDGLPIVSDDRWPPES